MHTGARGSASLWVIACGVALAAFVVVSADAQPRPRGLDAGVARRDAGGVPSRRDAGPPGRDAGAPRLRDAGAPRRDGAVPLADAGERNPTLGAAEQRARPLFERGSQLYAAGDLRGALRAFNDAFRIVQAAPIAYNIARVHARMAEPEEAIRWYRRYLQIGGASLTPEDRADAEQHIATAEAEMRRRRQMIAQLPATSAEMTAEARQFFERGEALFRRGRYQAALTAFTAAYNYVRIPEIAYNLALTSERLGRTDDAVLFYRDYLRLRRNAPDRAQIEAHIATLRDRP